jgi:hypothetical protein
VRSERPVRWLIVGLFVVHGLIHGLGAAKGLGWATDPQLSNPIGPVAGVLWLAAGVAVRAAGVLFAVAPESNRECAQAMSSVCTVTAASALDVALAECSPRPGTAH